MDTNGVGLNVYVKRMHDTVEMAGKQVIVNNWGLHMVISSHLNIDMMFMSACELLLELDTLDEVNRYYKYITDFFKKFGKLPILDDIHPAKTDRLNTRQKISYMNQSITSYRARVKAIANGFYLGHKADDYDMFTRFEYGLQYSLMEKVKLHNVLDPTDEIAIYIKLNTSEEDPTIYSLVSEVLSLREFNENNESVANSRNIIWHNPNELMKKLYSVELIECDTGVN